MGRISYQECDINGNFNLKSNFRFVENNLKKIKESIDYFGITEEEL